MGQLRSVARDLQHFTYEHRGCALHVIAQPHMKPHLEEWLDITRHKEATHYPWRKTFDWYLTTGWFVFDAPGKDRTVCFFFTDARLAQLWCAELGVVFNGEVES